MNFKAYETSSAQKRLYMVNRLLGKTILYNELRAFIIQGNLDPIQLKNATNRLSQRHEALRTSFVLKEGEILQKVYDHIEIDFKYTPGIVSSTDEIIENFLKPYDLAKAPLWKIELVQSSQSQQLLLFDFHHLIADGTSMDVIIKELTDLYLGKSLPEPEVQYVDFTIWQNDLFESDNIKTQEAYWLKVFGGGGPLLDLPLDFPRSLEAHIEGNTIEFEIEDRLTAGLDRLAAQNNTTLYVVLLAVLNILLSKYSGQEDIVVGTATAGRSHREFENIVGMFVNTLAIRNMPTADKTFKEFLAEVSSNAFTAFENQDYQFEMLVEKVVPERALNRNPFFDVMFALQNYSRNINISRLGDEDLVFISYRYKSKISKFDLSIEAFEVERHILFRLEYRTALFRADTIERLTGHWIDISRQVTENPGMKLSGIRLLSEAEENHLLYVLNDTAVNYPADKSLHELFEEESRQHPDCTALVGMARGAVDPYSLTYKELNEKSNHRALLLKEKGVQPGAIVGLMKERSIEMIIAMLGILKAGGTYLPIDPAYPKDRIDFMLKDSGLSILLTGNKLSGRIGNRLACSNSLPATCNLQPATSLAYILYTSGTTGKPKGIMIEHHSVVRLVKNSNVIRFTPRDRLLLTGAIVFDITTFEIWGPLLNGSTLCLVDHDAIMDGEKLGKIFCKYEISILHLIPQLCNQLAEWHPGIFAGLTYLLVGGDIVRPHYIDKLRNMHKNLKILHMYGPTENTTFSTFFPVEKDYKITIPIGKPISNSTVYITDQYGNLKPFGVVGELLVGGAGVARGYLNNPALTAEKFYLTNKKFCGGAGGGFSKEPLARRRLYKTGDLGRWLPDGNIEFIGRIDQQVKIRGIRVELEEIESRLMSHELIKEAVVIDRMEKDGEKYLCAYIVPGKGEAGGLEKNFDSALLRNYLSNTLPDYMIPSYFVKIAKIPLTPNGKVNRNALPVPAITNGAQYEKPGNTIEETLAAIWSEVLKVDKEVIGIDSNFFELGGHSLKASIVIAKIHKKLDVKLELAEFFRVPFIRGLAESIKGTVAERYAAVEAVEKKDYYVLSPAQRRLYILQQLDPQSTAYNMPLLIPLTDEPDVHGLERTFTRLIERHESLRTSFLQVNEEPVQRVHEEKNYKLQITNISKDFVRPFDLSHAPLLRVGLVSLHTPPLTGHPPQEGSNREKLILMVDMHHIIMDGKSQDILREEFMVRYRGEELGSSELRLRYIDFSEWQDAPGQRLSINRQESYWVKLFSGQLPVLDLPTDYPRPLMQHFEGCTVNFVLSEQETRGLKDIAKEANATHYMVLLSVYTVLLSKLSDQEDIIVGAPIAARRHADLEQIIGMFVNTLALRNEPKGGKTFKEFLVEVKDRTLAAYENQEYPFEYLVDKISPRRDTGRNPIFDVAFNMWNQSDSTGIFPGMNRQDLYSREYEHIPGASKFDMSLTAPQTGEGSRFFLNFEYSTRLFKAATVERFIGYLKKIISLVVEKPAIALSEIEILGEEEKDRLLFDFNRTASDYPADKTIHELLEEQVEKRPDKIAIVGPARDFGLHAVTYRQLNEKCNRLAKVLREKGVTAGGIAGLMLPRSIEMITGMIAILKAGGTYLPLTAKLPEERVYYMLQDGSAGILLSGKDLLSKFEYVNVMFKGKIIDLFDERIFKGNPAATENISAPGSPAYVIYTSGSTGKPKGVMVEHRSVVRLVKGSNYIDFSTEDRLLLTGEIVFDITTFEIWGPLLNGLYLYLIDENVILDAVRLEDFMVKNKVTVLHLIPQLFNQLAGYRLEIFAGLRYFLVGGDLVLPRYVNLLRDKYREIKILHMYGPTENTTFSTFFPVEKEYKIAIPIGKPISNSTVYIIDRYGNLEPLGVVGELCVGGAGVARGYLNNPALTAKKFIKSSFDNDRLYRTGDLARWLPDGDIEFVGRIDQQVKIRGIRVELEEIESLLLSHELIKEAVVIDRVGDDGEKYLCAYIVSKEVFDLPGLNDYLSKSIPVYMIPAFFVDIAKIPVTANGKVDRNALPAPGFEVTAGGKYETPVGSIEMQLAAIWSEVLNLDRGVIGVNSNFFKLGGHSLKATIMTAKVHKVLNVSLPLAEVFKTPFIRGLAKYIKKAKEDKYTAIEAVEKKDYYSLSSAQKRLYILQQLDPESTAYNMPVLIPLREGTDIEKLENAFKRLIQRHDSLRTSLLLVNKEPVQRIHEEKNYKFQIRDYNSQNPGLAGDFVSPFDLSKAPLLRVGLIKDGENKNILMVDMHHIITDAASQNILEKEFMDLYSGGGGELQPLRLRYKDYSEWCNSEEQAAVIKKQQDHWLKTFAGELPALDLPIDYPRPPVQSFEGFTIDFNLEEKETKLLNDTAQKTDSTLYMVLLAIYNVLLFKLGGQEDIIVGTPIAARRHADLERIIGMFVNTLAIRNYPSGDKPFVEFLEEVRQNTIAAYENQEYPFERLVEEVEVSRDAGRNPVFDVVFTFLDRETGTQPRQEPATNIPVRLHRVSKFDMTLTAVNLGNRLFLNFEYCTRLFKEKTIRRFIGYFKRIISALIRDPGQKISGIEIITEKEKKQILEEFNGAISDYPKDKTLHRLFAEQAEKAPAHVALIGKEGASGGIQLSYGELNNQSTGLAYVLKEQGVRPDTIVGITAGQSVETIIGILAILKAGGAYLPIDPDYPQDRIDFMLKDSGLSILLTGNKLSDRIGNRLACSNSLPATRNRQPATSLAYIIYTSGTTGKPKGMMIEHRNVVSLMKSDRFLFDFDGADVWTLFHSYCFDFSVWEMYGALLNGAKLIVIPRMAARDPARYLKILKQQGVTVLNQTPSAFYHLIDEELKCPGKQLHTRYVIFGGEALKPGRLKEWSAKYPGTKLVNMFGITETTVHVTHKELGQRDIESGISNIGKPLSTLTAYIMKDNFMLLPAGIAGECYVGGAGVGRGYLNRVRLTAEKFVENPYKPGEMLYKSGDLTRFLDNGEMEYLGRIDQQVKIRGFRIETGEIEGRLMSHNNIKEAVVLALYRQANEPGSLYLCAYFVADTALTVTQLREYLLKQLPDYMIPRYFMPVEKIPLTSNGKVDRRRLPLPEVASTARYVAPKTSHEKLVAGIWAQVLELEEVGVATNFFELGGNSLDFIKINSRLKEALNIDIPIALMFRYPNIRDFAGYLSQEKGSRLIDREEEKSLGSARLGKMRNMKKKRG